MNKTLGTTLIVVAAVALAAGLFFFGYMYARSNSLGATGFAQSAWASPYGPGMMQGRSDNGPGMMRGRGSYGPGMMQGRGGYGPGGMMGQFGRADTNVAPLTADQATAAAQKYLANLDNADLKVAEIMVFDNNAYVAVKESSTGRGAFELLVDPTSQIAYPEHGPNMMWNLKYAALNHQYMMGGSNQMMGGQGFRMGGVGQSRTAATDVSADMTVTPEQAVEYAQKYLDANLSGATAASDPMKFYGYYTLDFSQSGKVAGMLSVNGYSGQVFLHTWHGTFISESQIQ
jgi:hypothetical protein